MVGETSGSESYFSSSALGWARCLGLLLRRRQQLLRGATVSAGIAEEVIVHPVLKKTETIVFQNQAEKNIWFFSNPRQEETESLSQWQVLHRHKSSTTEIRESRNKKSRPKSIEKTFRSLITLTDRQRAADGDQPDDLAPPTAGQQDTQLAEVEGEHQQGDGQGQQEATANSIIVVKR